MRTGSASIYRSGDSSGGTRTHICHDPYLVIALVIVRKVLLATVGNLGCTPLAHVHLRLHSHLVSL
jgi:hypothetical protein